jgi:hypothetical protein
MTGTLSVEAAALVRQASGRYSDALACDALGHYVGHVGGIPDGAWGSIPWAQTWKAQWHDAVADRVKEAQLANERFDDVAQTLYQVAADYTHTDIQVGASFAAIDESPVMPFVTALEHPSGAAARPGGHLSLPAAYTGGTYAVSIPDNTPEGHDLNLLWQDNAINRTEMWPAGTDLSQTPTGKMRAAMMTEGRQKLWEFLNRWSGDLAQAEAITRQYGVAPARSCTDIIDEAGDAWPGVIANRANLLKLGANAYHDLRGNLTSQVKDLQQYWTSPGASGAYYIYADSLGDYYDKIAGNLEWLAEEGEKAAKTIDNLQLQYANYGYERMGIIADQLQAYLDAVNGLSKSVEQPVAALAATLTSFASALLTSLKAAGQEAQAAMDMSRTAINDAPSFNDNAHDTAQPPQSPSNTWRSGWKP